MGLTEDRSSVVPSSVSSIQYKKPLRRQNSQNTVKIMFVAFAVVCGLALASSGDEKDDEETSALFGKIGSLYPLHAMFHRHIAPML